MRRAFFCLLLLAGCSQPVAVITERGDALVGRAESNGGTLGRFEVTNGDLICWGYWDAGNFSFTVDFSISCSDHRTGIGTMTRDTSFAAGRGSLRMNDGEAGDFVFGPAAIGVQPHVRTR